MFYHASGIDLCQRLNNTLRQSTIVKLQTLTLAAKLLVLSPADRTIGLLTKYVLSLARYDQNFDVRDRGRMLGALLAGVSPALLADGEDEREEQGGELSADLGGVEGDGPQAL